MAARQGFAAHVTGDAAPFIERLKTFLDHAVRTPQYQQRREAVPDRMRLGMAVPLPPMTALI